MGAFYIFPKSQIFHAAVLHHEFGGLNFLRNIMLFWDCSLTCSSVNFTLKKLLFAACPLCYPTFLKLQIPAGRILMVLSIIFHQLYGSA